MTIRLFCSLLSEWQPIWSRTKLLQKHSFISRAAYFHSLHVRAKVMRTQKLHIGFGLDSLTDKPVVVEVLLESVRWNCITTDKNKYETISCTCRIKEQAVFQRSLMWEPYSRKLKNERDWGSNVRWRLPWEFQPVYFEFINYYCNSWL